ncbi:mpv17-like protein 2 [Microplitis demolitor]|uniref:mpv17-like protein 2 n=1 Tax=Microplitis demolitor TaxID=69319 RepID=UPI0004CDD064|nr:mpv17-like protein 2 [Microplitis demolitor]
MNFIKHIVFGKYLVVTNTVSCGLMMGIGDILQQRSEQWKRKYLQSSTDQELDIMDDKKSNLLFVNCSNNFNDDSTSNQLVNLTNKFQDNDSVTSCHDLVRTKNMAMIGMIQGPFNHFFYAFLDRFLPGKTARSIVKKTFLDQVIASPTCLSIFFFGHEMLEQRDFRLMYGEILEKLVETYKVDCCFWPPTQMLNFLFVPMRYRVIYINLMNVFYNIFLSYTKYDAD